MLEAGVAHVARYALELVKVGELPVGDPEPAEPVALVRSGPQRRVAVPEPARLA
jgi:hypothetical protein